VVVLLLAVANAATERGVWATTKCQAYYSAAYLLTWRSLFTGATLCSAVFAVAGCLFVRLSVCPSVGLSVTRRYCV